MTESKPVVAWGREDGAEGQITKGHEETFQVMDILIIWVLMLLSQMCICVRTSICMLQMWAIYCMLIIL